jgi:hypothetical protein
VTTPATTTAPADKKPEPSRPELLDAWLRSVKALDLWQVRGPKIHGHPSMLEGYSIQGREVICRTWAGGWEIFRPASQVNSVDAALTATAEFCGVKASE